jgi:S-adenosylmethionine hydrolase
MTGRERPVIGFLTDFGLDGAAATCRGVMLGICRDAQIVDICHTVTKYAIRDGAFILRSALPYLPIGVHVGVVDPGVGTERRAIAIRCARGDVLVGPDNGLLPPAAEALGGVSEARELTNPGLWLPGAASATFHGRDIFAPVAAHLAAGDAELAAVGPTVPLDDLVRLPDPRRTVRPGALETEATYVDSFGNVRLAAGGADLAAAFADVEPGQRLLVTIGDAAPLTMALADTFGSAAQGAAIVYVDSSGNVALAVRQGDFAHEHQVSAGAAVRIGEADDSG